MATGLQDDEGMQGRHVPVEHEELAALVARLGLGTTASELHGSLCGFLAAGGRTSGESLLMQLHVDAEAAAPDAHDDALLGRLVRHGITALADPELGFEPLLPDDDRPLPERAEAMAEWCRGFLGGFGLAGAAAHAGLSEEAEETLHDFGAIAGSSFDYGNENEDEDALIEVHEFVRVGAMLLHAECAARLHAEGGTLH